MIQIENMPQRSGRPQVMHRVGASNRSLLNDPWSAPTVARTDACDFWGPREAGKMSMPWVDGCHVFQIPPPRVVDLYHLASYSNMPKIRLLKTGNSLKIVPSVGAAGARDIRCHYQAWLPKGMEARWVLWERESNGGGHLSSKLPPKKNVGETN